MKEKTNIQKLLEKDSKGHFSDPNKEEFPITTRKENKLGRE